MDLHGCLQRIDYRGPRVPNFETLTALQRQFLCRVPFENLDVHLGRPITLSLDRIYEKIVKQGRGGFCYECNNLFHAMLSEMGFDVAFHGATMLIENTLYLEFGHMVLSVQLERSYLADVGNGQSFRDPLRLDGRDCTISEDIEYRVRAGADEGTLVLYYRDEATEWKPRYRFTTEPQRLENFAEPCHIQQTSPDSRFTRHCLATLATPDGRVTLMDGELTVRRGERCEVRALSDVDDYGRVLSEYFGIHLPAEAVRTLYQRIKS